MCDQITNLGGRIANLRDQIADRVLRPVDMALRQAPSLQAQHRFKQAYFGVGSSISLAREGAVVATMVALFRTVPAVLTTVASGVAVGAGALWGVVGAGNASWIFYREVRDYQVHGAELRDDQSAHSLVSTQLKAWSADLARDPYCSIEAYASRRQTCAGDIRCAMQAAIRVERCLPAFRRAGNALQAGWLTFLRDAGIQLANAGIGFARIVKWLFPVARVSAGVLSIAASVVGIAGGIAHIAGGKRDMDVARSTMGRCAAVAQRVDEDTDALRQCADAAAVAAFLLRTDRGPQGLAFGKVARATAQQPAPVRTGTEPAPSAADPVATDAVAVDAKAGAEVLTPGNPDAATVAEPVRKERPDRYAGHVSKADPGKLEQARQLCDQLFVRMKTNEALADGEAKLALRVAKQRIAFGSVTLVLSSVSLGLSLSGVGTVAGMVLSGLASAALQGAASFWNGYASFRAGRLRAGVLARQDAAGADGAASPDDRMIDDIMALLRDTSPQTALARKLLKGALREHGVTATAMDLFKSSGVFGERMGIVRQSKPARPNSDGRVVDEDPAEGGILTLRKQIVDLISGDGARAAIAEGRAAKRSAPVAEPAPLA